MKRILVHIKKQLKHFIIGPAFKLLEAVLELFMPLLMANIIDIGISNGDTPYIIKTGIVMLIIAIIGVVSACICQYSAAVAAQGFGSSLRKEMFSKAMKMSFSQIDKYGTSTLFSRITGDSAQLVIAVNMTIRLVVRAPFICIGTVIASLFLDVKLGLIMLVTFPLFALCLYFITRKTSTIYAKVQKNVDKINNSVKETMSGVRVIRAFNAEENEEAQFNKNNEIYLLSATKVGKFAALLNPLTVLILNIAIIAIIWFGGIRINSGSLTSGELLAFISYLTQMLTTLIVVANLVVIFTRAGASLNRVEEFLKEETNEIIPAGNKYAEFSNGSIEFKNVTFSYGGGESEINEISFKINSGETLGIIGSTGCGKSTLVNLVQKFYVCNMGEILIGGRNIKQIHDTELRSNIAVVPQKIELISGTISDNIRLGNQFANHSEIVTAAKIAQANDFIEQMPQKYESLVHRGGVNLSGGQKQRIAIARALIKKAKILILDDSSSALDFATDAALRNDINKKFVKTTKIIVAQRVWAIRNCDKIIVLEDGRMAGFDTHENLLNSCKEYFEICESQKEGDL